MKIAIALVLLAACGDDGGSTTADGGTDSGGSSFTTCTGTCTTTGVTATFGANTKTLDEAYYGITASTQTVYLEVLAGGNGTCPTTSSPSEDYTLVLSTVAVPTDITAQSPMSAAFDFKGDLLPNGAIHAFGTSATLTPTNANMPAAATGFIAADVSVAFGGDGTMTGHLYAIHCASFDTTN
ncbi:MAG TPA: hypothetical protein VGM90_26775 [Kofleriaceae bacterium]|jgi:hypothetical protein